MFELTCPSCRAKRTSPFVRVGAATRCPSCDHTWRISDSHISKVAPAGADSGTVSRPMEPVIGEAPPEDDPRADSSVTGMSGLSDLMQAEPNAAQGSMAGRTVPPIEEGKLITTQAPAPARPEPRPSAMSQQHRRLAILVIALLAFGVALAGIGLAMMGGEEPTIPAPNPGEMVPDNAGPAPATPASPGGSADPLPLPAGPPSQPEPREPGVDPQGKATSPGNVPVDPRVDFASVHAAAPVAAGVVSQSLRALVCGDC